MSIFQLGFGAFGKGQLQTPDSHKELALLQKEVGMKLLPIFQHLIIKNLFERCLKNRKQNACMQNMHANLDSGVPAKFFHNMLNILPGAYLKTAVKKASIERIKVAERTSSEGKKK